MNVLFVVTRNEADLLRLNLAHHLAWGFDHVAIADNESTDATRDVLSSFGDAVTVEVIQDVNDRFASLGRLLHRIEARRGPAQWVAISDTDEFWWQPGNGLASLLASVPPSAVGLNTAQKLFLPTALDPTAGPCYLRRTWRTTGPASPLHSSYRRGKSMYRASWVRAHEISSAHWCTEVPSRPWRPARPLVHHYMINDEESFVQKVLALQRWSPEVGKTRVADDPAGQDAHDAAELRRRFRDFKVEWWRVYSAGGEEAVRQYFRTKYMIPASAVPGHVARGELVQDTEFADYMRGR